MVWTGSRSIASWHPAPSSFPRKPVFDSPANFFRFIGLRALFSHGNFLLLSFQEVTHSFPSHGTGAYPPRLFSISLTTSKINSYGQKGTSCGLSVGAHRKLQPLHRTNPACPLRPAPVGARIGHVSGTVPLLPVSNITKSGPRLRRTSGCRTQPNGPGREVGRKGRPCPIG
jgi:hypothetical protein